MTGPMDPSLRAALDEAVSWEGDLRRVRTIWVEGARSLDGLPHLPRLKRLKLHACDLTDLAALSSLPALEELTLSFSCIGDNAALARLSGLRKLELRCGDQRQLDGILELPALQQVTAVATPLDSDAAERLRARFGDRLTISEPHILQMCRALADAGIPACYALDVIDDREVRSLIRLGPGRSQGEPVLHPPSEQALLDALAEGASSWDDLAVRFQRRQPAPTPAAPRFDADAHVRTGGATDARAWIAELPQDLRAAAGRFIDAWPDLRFQRFDAPLFDFAEGQDGVTFPGWLRQAWGAFAGLDADQGVRYHFGSFGALSPDALDQHAFGLGLRGAVTARESEVFVRGGLYPIGGDRGVLLAVNVRAPDDPRVYQLRDRTLQERHPDGFGPEQALKAFPDLAALLDGVVAVTVAGVRRTRPGC